MALSSSGGIGQSGYRRQSLTQCSQHSFRRRTVSATGPEGNDNKSARNKQVWGWLPAAQWPAPIAAGNKTSQACWVLNEKQSKVSRLSKQVPLGQRWVAPLLGCTQQAIENQLCGVFHAELAVGADARLPGLELPPAPAPALAPACNLSCPIPTTSPLLCRPAPQAAYIIIIGCSGRAAANGSRLDENKLQTR